MKEKMKLIVVNLSLLFLSLHLSSLFHFAIAKGGLISSNFSGLGDSSYVGSARHLFEEKKFSMQEHIKRLNKLAEGYMSNAELEKAIKEFNRRCSSISRVYSIGESALGVPLWVIEISDKPGKDEPEPAFKFIGNVHGDEPVGRELLLHLANWLCDNYMQHPLATLIVNNVHLHILPSLNPDGFQSRLRGNANNVDLNRDFPDQFFHMNDDLGMRQPETKAIMSWLEKIHFTASVTLHGGALVANYPWDGTSDEKYPIYGGMQDWNYIYAGCFELTLEISDDKWPNASEIPVLWEFNRMSMLNLVASLVKTGIHGRIFSSDYGSPLAASISIKGINSTIKAGKVFADYHRLLTPGEKYEVVASMPGYKSKSTRIILGEEASTVDFILDPVVAARDDSLPSRCDCSFEKREQKLIELLPGQHSEILIVVILILLFLCFLMKRRVILNYLRPKQMAGQKRPLVV
ncbi:carboxypeptidase SOL1-like isoform X2 [Coffea arabica]|uniref:Carboxypeptidase SOL1-like isoform X2 n=1 Tax=Coffea arabica TaxID=13443 RepID=A0ABM4VW60_COFAR